MAASCVQDRLHPVLRHGLPSSAWLEGFEEAYLLDVVVAQGSSIFELLPGEDQTLLVRGDSLLVLDLGLDVVDCVRGLDLEGDSLAREGFDETGLLLALQEIHL